MFTSPTATPDLPSASIATNSAQDEMAMDREVEEELVGYGKKRSPKAARRRKVNQACLYCRRSHMTCDEGRPCQRCIKREIGHLCHDENKPSRQNSAQSQTTMNAQVMPVGVSPAATTQYTASAVATTPAPSWPGLAVSQSASLYPLESRELSSLSDFLETLDEQEFFTGAAANDGADIFGNTALDVVSGAILPPHPSSDSTTPESPISPGQHAQPQVNGVLQRYVDLVPPVLPTADLTEKFLLTAADPAPGSRDERLRRVIRTKYEAGLLKPYNFVKGYSRLLRWLDCNVSQESKQQILQPLSVLRPKFRAVAQSLRDIDLIFIEEAFERLMLEYDRYFSSMGIPACLWRRTGEVYKGNREFAELVGVEGSMLREGRLCIYELMTEESAVNYWEKYGNVAFDATQKAVLTSCVLRFKSIAATPGCVQPTAPSEEAFINCCFSFTIRRDTWGIPLMIVGNFIRCR